MRLDVNCDLGEGEPISRTRALMRWITSANVACGGHAGDLRSMRTCARLAKQYGVKIGAHPGAWSRADKGRGVVRVTPDELALLLVHQVSALERVAVREGGRLHHIKLHGALYHAVETDPKLARAYLRCVSHHWPGVKIYALAGGRVVRGAERIGVPYSAEAFADRAYLRDGSLVPRSRRGAVLKDVGRVEARVRDLLAGRGLIAIDGHRIQRHVDTLCVHADTPNAVLIARALVEAAVSREGGRRPYGMNSTDTGVPVSVRSPVGVSRPVFGSMAKTASVFER